MIKILKLLVLILLVGIFTVGCNNILPTRMPINNAIREKLSSEDEDYDFIQDEEFLEIVDEYANTIPNIDKDVQYAIGNLDDEDNIPELAIFMDKNPEDIDSKTELVLYKFTGDSYKILDRIDMNHDTSNHLLQIGNISEDQKGLFISNNVGAHSTVTYGFILEDGKLKSILNENKVSLISLYPENEIKDIDDDGVLEFSIYTIDPETKKNASESESDMISIWYKWDGKDGAKVVMTESSSSYGDNISKSLLNKYNKMKLQDVLSHLHDNIDDYSQDEITQILQKYMERLEENLLTTNQSPLLGELLEKTNEHNLSVERLNDTSYLSRDNVLGEDITDFLKEKLALGYKLVETEAQYYFTLDNQFFIDNYKGDISRLFLNYLEIKAFNSNQPYLKDGALVIDRDNLAQRIIAIENYKLAFPYSRFISELSSIYSEYMKTFILGTVNSPNYDLDTHVFSDGTISVFKRVASNNPNTNLEDVLEFVIEELESNLNMLSPDLREYIEEKI